MQLPSMRTPEDILGLKQLCEEIVTPKSIIIEVGSYSGESAAIFARHCGLFIAIDPWVTTVERNAVAGVKYRYDRMRLVEQTFDKRMRKFGSKVIKVKATSEQASHFFLNQYADLVYIDALHNYKSVLRDIKFWLPKVKSGGWIGGHNYGKPYEGLIRAVTESLGTPNKVYRDSSWIVKVGTANTSL
jgi:predicted O-methyltransferase YrrM